MGALTGSLSLINWKTGMVSADKKRKQVTSGQILCRNVDPKAHKETRSQVHALIRDAKMKKMQTEREGKAYLLGKMGLRASGGSSSKSRRIPRTEHTRSSSMYQPTTGVEEEPFSTMTECVLNSAIIEDIEEVVEHHSSSSNCRSQGDSGARARAQRGTPIETSQGSSSSSSYLPLTMSNLAKFNEAQRLSGRAQ